MQAIETTRLPTPGGAPGPPPVSDDEMLPFVFAAPAGDEPPAARRAAFGRRLTAARERNGVALEDIARSMKVSPALLTALERGDDSRWPKGLFRRAFFRNYAAAIGLAPDPSITEFLLLFPDGEDHPPLAGTAAGADTDGSPALRLALAGRSGWHVSRRRVLQEIGILGAILLVAFLLTRPAGGTPLTFAAAVALCYYGRLSSAAVGRAARVWRRLRGRASARKQTPTTRQS